MQQRSTRRTSAGETSWLVALRRRRAHHLAHGMGLCWHSLANDRGNPERQSEKVFPLSGSGKLVDARTGAYIEVYMDGGPNSAPRAEHFDISDLPIGVPVRLTAGEAPPGPDVAPYVWTVHIAGTATTEGLVVSEDTHTAVYTPPM